MPPPMAVRRWHKSRRIYVRPRTGPQSAHLWWPAVAELQAASVPGSCAMGQTDERTSVSFNAPTVGWGTIIRQLTPRTRRKIIKRSDQLFATRIMSVDRNGCEVLQSACWHICMSLHTRISKTTRLHFTLFCVHVACGRGSVICWRQQVAVAEWVAQPTAGWRDPGSNLTANGCVYGDCYCDMQPSARAAPYNSA